MDFIKKVDKDKKMSEFKGEEGKISDISFISNCTFDHENRFFVGYGKEKLLVFNFTLKIQNHQIFKIKTFFEEIHAARLISSSDINYKCMVACKKKGRNQISIYDIAEHAKCDDQDKHLDGTTVNHNQIDMIYYTEMSKEKSKVEISLDLQKIIFVNEIGRAHSELQSRP